MAQRSDIFISPDGSLVGVKGGEGGLAATAGRAKVVALDIDDDDGDNDDDVDGEDACGSFAGNANDTFFFGFSQVLMVKWR